MGGLTHELARFTVGLKSREMPPAALATIRAGFIDCLGVTIAGHVEAAPNIVLESLASSDHPEQATILPGGRRVNADDAALVNSVSAHVLDYDDVTLDGHPSAVLVPAILAQSETLSCSGCQLESAYAVGYECWCELLIREPIPLYAKGWHPTATRGAVAAAAACAHLLRLDTEKTATALAIAASMASGLVANFGSMTKCFQVGRAAQAGIVASRLAKAGLTASLDALEHPSGFLNALSPSEKPTFDASFDPTRHEWHLIRQGLNIKRYPVCYGAHRVIDAILDCARTHALKADQVESITVFSAPSQMLMMRNERPRTALEAKFSMPFAVAAALVAGKVGLRELTDDFVRSDAVQSLLPKVSYVLTEKTLLGSAFAAADWVTIRMRSGEVFESDHIVHAKGSKEQPLTPSELAAKFKDCAEPHLSASSISALIASLSQLDAIPNTRALLALIEPRSHDSQ